MCLIQCPRAHQSVPNTTHGPHLTSVTEAPTFADLDREQLGTTDLARRPHRDSAPSISIQLAFEAKAPATASCPPQTGKALTCSRAHRLTHRTSHLRIDLKLTHAGPHKSPVTTMSEAAAQPLPKTHKSASACCTTAAATPTFLASAFLCQDCDYVTTSRETESASLSNQHWEYDILDSLQDDKHHQIEWHPSSP